MAKIVYIGAGSKGFARNLITDMFIKPALAGSHFVLMDISADNLAHSFKFAQKLKKQLDSPMTLEVTTDLTTALDGADYVFETTLKHGLETRMREHQCCHKYNLFPYSGCTTGPAGVFRALREIPATLEILRIMEKVCPNAYYLHYANPTNTVSLGLSVASPIKSVGLCHSVEGTAKQMSWMLGVPFEQVAYWAAGVNHQAWILKFEQNKKDLYPQFRELYNNPNIYKNEMVRFEMMDFFGYFPTESSFHNSEYVPYFRRTREECEKWSPGAPIDDKYGPEIAERNAQLQDMLNAAESDEPVPIYDHCEFCVRIIEAIETNKAFLFNGNILNKGLITNLPPDICVEVPIIADGTGLHPCYVGDLPPQCAALNANRSAGDLLAVKGTLEGDKKAVEQAIALDPLTASVLTLDQIRSLTADLFEADKEFLPQFKF
ncbi:MAG: alpha-glucosidase/alpha-galactosidase [Oscillospiraceae bacterium]|nr:alpha-glucosidase/alpha-galactosidase [Oscillospiraceae bacterium]